MERFLLEMICAAAEETYYTHQSTPEMVLDTFRVWDYLDDSTRQVQLITRVARARNNQQRIGVQA